MNSTLTRSRCLHAVLAGAFVLVSGCSDYRNAPNCENYDHHRVRANVLKKLKENHPRLAFEITNVYFSPAAKFPFWHVESVTDSTGPKQMIFAMHYCDGSVELTALNPYEP